MNRYYAEYYATSVEGCVKTFISEGRDKLHFPPQVSYSCDLCGVTHSFWKTRMHQVATPKQQQRLEDYCTAHNIERDVHVPE